ncbi:MAG: putative response regulatory protein [Caproiciproducens sp.]|nr:putative response regulatory protein [Caproiciproducens sp.]
MKMYKVIIIDDEDIIVQGLKKVVNWAKYGSEVVATASDAKSGAQAIRENSPDILFTDIKMPNMDGLTMLAGLKGEFPNMQITVLTGYRDFEYAKRALHLGVTRFLLKPSKMNELEEALQIMTENLGKLQPGAPEEKKESEEEQQDGNPANSFIVRSALKYIEVHYAEKLTLTELAEKTYVSQWYLSKLLNKYTDKSFCDLLNQTRIKKAEKLLKDPSLKIHEVSDMLGFNDVTHFSKIFKKIEQVSPNEYRNSSQE